MIDPIAFLLASFVLLAAPGPTNTLLAMSGAADGMVRSLKLIPAVATGYLANILVVALLVAPVLSLSRWLDAGLRVACAAYLVWSAWRLWRRAAGGQADKGSVSVGQTFVATLLNPKGLVFALVLVPHLKDGRLYEAAPYLAALVLLIVASTAAWIGAGVILRAAAGSRMNSQTVNRAGAGLLAGFGLMIAASTMSLSG